VSLAVVLAMTIGAAAQRLAGMFLLGRRMASTGPWARFVGLIPVAVISSVVALQTLTTAGEVDIDARLVGVGLAAVATWRGMPVAVVVLVAAGSTAALRALGWG
jgi:hypothetical protein